MNKNELVSAVAQKAGLTKADAKKAIDATTEVIADALKAGDKIALIGFGTFSVAERGERKGVNPATGAQITIPAKKSAKFKGGKELTDSLN